jgi:hypothetical protein
VYLCSFVAFGIAKKTEDYLEALYRWAAGPLELLWASLFSWNMMWHNTVVACPVFVIAMASFAEGIHWYYLHLAMALFFVLRVGGR